jgi:hypothetical protein
MERDRREHEGSSIGAGFRSELLVLSLSVIEAASLWNLRESRSPDSGPITGWPIFSDPLYYRTNIGKIGMLREGWIGGALIGFYGNLLELNDQTREAVAGHLTVNVTSQSIAERLRVMASNLSQALDGLNNDQKIAVPADIDLNLLCAPKGKIFANSASLPNNLQDVLLKLAGQ